MSSPKLTREQAAIIGAYTGVTCGPFGDVHEYAERLMGESLTTIAFAMPQFVSKLRERARDDFLSICADKD